MQHVYRNHKAEKFIIFYVLSNVFESFLYALKKLREFKLRLFNRNYTKYIFICLCYILTLVVSLKIYALSGLTGLKLVCTMNSVTEGFQLKTETFIFLVN